MNNVFWFFNPVLVLLLFQLFFPHPATAQNILIKFYQEHISAVDGNRCQMTPSCSAYASKAIDRHGLIVGWMMTCDRLVRCGHDEVKLAEKRIIGNDIYAIDTVEKNDNWWFFEPKKR